MNQTDYQFYDLLVKVLGGIIAYLTVIVGYMNFKSQIERNRQEREAATRQQAEDLKWRRAQFLIQLWKDFNSDLTLRQCIKLVDAGDSNPRIAGILKTDPWALSDSDADIRYNFDRYLDFLQSLAYCETKGTLTLDEVACFGWHFEKILDSSTLKEYCLESGYHDVVALARKLELPTEPPPNSSLGKNP